MMGKLLFTRENMKNKPDWNEKLNLPQSVIDDIDNAIMELVMTGMVEMSIGEDGEIYLSITPEGRKYVENLEEF
jgi:DNA-binding MarR family transcriptional regulator